MKMITEVDATETIPQDMMDLMIARSHRIEHRLQIVLSIAVFGFIVSNAVWFSVFFH